jgi:peptidoglycan/LPS O-acetylase OafA/YrhL
MIKSFSVHPAQTCHKLKMKHRGDIQILRGLAVILVVLFHLGIAGFESGLLGVDIFFVISGFLMASIYQEDATLQFYQRRAGRLLPAYFFTILVTIVASSLVTVPVDDYQVVEQSLFASIFASNIGFWLQNSYFDKAAFKPLLHLWSLSVEIQFYLVVPALFAIGRKRPWILPLLLAFSLLSCFLVTTVSPKTSFFLTPFRIWEFLIGWLVAWFPWKDERVRSGSNEPMLGIIGLAVLISVPLIPIRTESTDIVTGHPGVLALAVCLATGIVLAFSLPQAIVNNPVGRALELVGDYSYSIYLVHFPILVLALYEPFSGTLLTSGSVGVRLLLVILIGLASFASFNFIEQRGRRLYSAPRALCAVVVVAAVALVSALLLERSYPGAERKIFAAWSDRAVYRCGKLFRILNPSKIVCETTPSANLGANSAKLLLVGDSYADSIKSSFAAVAAKRGYRSYFLVPNDPLSNPRFDAARLLDEAKALSVKAVFVHFSPHDSHLDGLIEAFRVKLDKAEIPMVLLTPVPTYDEHVPAALYRHLTKNAPLPRMNLKDYHEHNERLFSYARSRSTKLFAYYDLSLGLCEPDCRLTDDDGRPAYFDNGHLTLSGARLLEDELSSAISALTPISVSRSSAE